MADQQRSLFDSSTSRLERAFQEFHAENPHVFDLFVRFADEARQRGRTRLSIAFLTERIRWFTNIETTGDEFKINNNHRAFYARKLMEIPRFAGMFATREQAGGNDEENDHG